MHVGGCAAIPCWISRVDIAYASWQIFQPCRTFQVNSFMHMKKLQKEQPEVVREDVLECVTLPKASPGGQWNIFMQFLSWQQMGDDCQYVQWFCTLCNNIFLFVLFVFVLNKKSYFSSHYSLDFFNKWWQGINILGLSVFSSFLLSIFLSLSLFIFVFF